MASGSRYKKMTEVEQPIEYVQMDGLVRALSFYYSRSVDPLIV